jgi:hypothetical protein
MKNYITRPLLSKPGIQRDGTNFASDSYIDGQWCRFYMGRPRKIGGYKLIDIGNKEIIRSLFGVPKPNSIDTYLGRESSISYNNFDFNGDAGGEVDRTPLSYEAVPNNVWDMDLFTTAEPELVSYIVASAIPNGDDISNRDNGNIYYGDTQNNLPLVQINDTDENPVQVSGGIVFSSPVMIAYGNDGFMQWSNLGDIETWDPGNNLIIDNTKVVQMYRTRGGSTPQLLAWTLGSLISLTFVPGGEAGTFSKSTIEDSITVMSVNSIIQYNQQFFWIGIDQFYFFNGIVQKLDNSMSTDWFFQHVNLNQRSKVWGMAIPRFKELWWFYPRDGAIECNACIIYNTELNVWYDSLKNRAAGLSPGIFPLPLMSDSSLESIPSGRGFVNNYGLWMHEYGFDKIVSNVAYAVDSFFETHIMTLFSDNPENNRLIRTRRIEPDFNQIGNMTVTVNNRMFASDTLANGQTIQTGPISFNGNTQKIDDVDSQGRLVSYVFRSNEVGGVYQAGQTLLDYEIGDVKPGSN